MDLDQSIKGTIQCVCLKQCGIQPRNLDDPFTCCVVFKLCSGSEGRMVVQASNIRVCLASICPVKSSSFAQAMNFPLLSDGILIDDCNFIPS